MKTFGVQWYGVDELPKPESVWEDSPLWTMQGILPPETGICKEAAADIIQDLGDKIDDPDALVAALHEQTEIIVTLHYPLQNDKLVRDYIRGRIKRAVQQLQEANDVQEEV